MVVVRAGRARPGRRRAARRLSAQPAAAQPATATASVDAGLAALYARLEQALVAGEPSQILAATSAAATNGDRLSAFAQSQAFARAVRAVIRERDRAPLEDAAEGTRLPHAARGVRRVRRRPRGGADVVDRRDPDAGGRRLASRRRRGAQLGGRPATASRSIRTGSSASAISSVRAEDLLLTFPSGVAYVASRPRTARPRWSSSATARCSSRPKPAMEQTQLRIFSGETELRAPIGAAFLRYHPVDRGDRISGTLTEEPVSASSLRRAQAIFEEEIGKSFGIELADLSRERWSLVPPVGDFLAEIRTKSRFGTLTYVRSGGEAEDISLFQRARRRNIAVYASTHRLKTRGSREFSEDDEADYDVSHYSIGATIDPDRQQIEGRTEMRLTVRATGGRHAHLQAGRIAERRTASSAKAWDGCSRCASAARTACIVNLPRTLVRGTTISLTITYGGRLTGASADREAVAVQQDTVDPRGVRPHRRTAPPLQQSQLLVPAGAGHRLRDRRAAADRPRQARLRRLGHAGQRQPGAGHEHARPRPALRLPGRTSRRATSRRDLAARSGRRRRDRRRRPRITVAVQANPRQKGAGAAVGGGGGDPRRLRRRARRLPVSEPDARARGRPAARRPQPGLFRARQPAAAGDEVHLGQRSRGLRWLPAVLPRARDRAPVLGRRGRLGELSRAMDQRRLRAVLRAALRRALARRRPRRGHPPQAAHDRDRRTPIKARSGSAIASATCRTTDACSAPSSTTRARWCCTCCGAGSATTPSSAACARSTRSRATRRSGRGTCSASSRPSRAPTCPASSKAGSGRRTRRGCARRSKRPADRCRCASTRSAR